MSYKSLLNLKSNSGQLFLIFSIQGINAILGFIVQLLISNNLTTAEYGKFNVIFNAISILIWIISLGSTNYILKKVSTLENSIEIAKTLNKTISYVFVNWFLVVLLFFVVYEFTNKSSLFSVNYLIFWSSALWLLLSALTVMFQNFDRARGFAIRSMLPSSIIKSCIIIGSLGIGLFYLDQLKLYHITFTYLFSFLFACSLYLFFEKKYLSLKQIILKVTHKHIFEESSQYFINKLAQNLLKNLDLILIGFFLTDYDAGIYGAATKINIIIIFGLSSLSILYSPQVAKLYHKSKISQLNTSLKTPNLVIFIFSFTLFMAITIFGKNILALFGEEYQKAFWILLLLSLRNLTEAFFGITGSVLNMTGNQKYFNKILYILLIIYIVISPLIIKYYELEGFALFLVLLTLAKNFIQWRFIFFKLGIESGLFSNLYSKFTNSYKL